MCYISMSGDDGYSPEVIHEDDIANDLVVYNSMTCPRCKALDVELDAELDTYFNDHAIEDADECGYSETIAY